MVRSRNLIRIFENFIILLLSLIIVLVGLIQGSRLYKVQIEIFSFVINIIWLNAVSSSLIFSSFILISALSFWFRLRSRKETEQVKKPISVIVPAYKEADILENSVNSLLETGYDNLEIIIVCEPEDSNTKARANSFESEKVKCVINEKYPGSKAGALNYGVEKASEEFLAFFDADQKVNPDFFQKTLPWIDEYEVVKARQIPQPKNIVESLAYYESVFFSYLTREFLYRFTNFRLVGSRSVIIRKDTFDKVGGFDRDALTEDYLFSHKCYKSKIDVKSLPSACCKEKAAQNLKDWWGQRLRWMTGYFQVFYELVRDLFRTGTGYRDVFSALIAGSSLLGSIFMLLFVTKMSILIFLGSEVFYTLSLATIAIIGLLFRVKDYYNKNIEKIGFSWIFVFLMFPFFTIVTLKALLESFKSENEWYAIRKT